MNKIIALVATTAIAGSTLMSTASAQGTVPERNRPTVNQVERDRPTVSQLVAYDEARIARLKADLRLNKDQDGTWGKFESALKDISKERADRFIAWTDERAKRTVSTERLPPPRCRAPAQAGRCDGKHAVDLKEVADASEPCWRNSTTPKRRASESLNNPRLPCRPRNAQE